MRFIGESSRNWSNIVKNVFVPPSRKRFNCVSKIILDSCFLLIKQSKNFAERCVGTIQLKIDLATPLLMT